MHFRQVSGLFQSKKCGWSVFLGEKSNIRFLVFVVKLSLTRCQVRLRPWKPHSFVLNGQQHLFMLCRAVIRYINRDFGDKTSVFGLGAECSKQVNFGIFLGEHRCTSWRCTSIFWAFLGLLSTVATAESILAPQCMVLQSLIAFKFG